ncbi:hypothetical protein [Gaiella sp.]|jgi:hypothetical protein|uniref:hypothetical protein n=1 Tax=Gaiella sp. TaxID=2663207 RepID=UPI002E2FBBBD|nr:hypothetical protein [Gaiella sp.]HEX5582218.1 hypothetical protein [Gaiella sp.]
MINRKRKRRIALVALLAFVLGTTAFAYAASITFNGGTAGAAGQGSGTISGYVVSDVHYTLDDNDPSNITGVVFSLNPDTATTVKAKITGMADWAVCTGGASPWSCPVTGDAAGAENLEVAAAD